MKSFFALVSCALGLAGLAQAHMEMTSPAPFKSKANPHAGSDVDYSMTAPLSAGGGNFPCKGYHSLFGTDAGKPTAEYKAGGTYQMTITGGANHGGGSCQASLSFDKGASWTVIHSYIGNCPAAGTSNLDFTIPADTPSGDVIFAWTWFNKVGNREMYMNCAAVTITGGSKKRADKRATAMSARPALFVANVNNGCSTKEGSDLAFPNPGPDESDESSNTSPPVGTCSGGGGSGNVGTNPGSGDGNSGAPSSPAASAPAATSKAPVATSQAPVAPSQPAVTPSAPANGGSPSSIPGGVFITVSEPADAPVAPTSVVASAPVVPTSAVNNSPVAPSSTLLTITRSAGGETPAVPTTPAAPTVPSAAPSASPSAAPSAAPGSGSGSGTTNTPGTPCKQEGEWNCIGGTQFQRCASGNWSVVMNMAPGTNCSNGFGKAKRAIPRYARV